jgi:hypothetical protein
VAIDASAVLGSPQVACVKVNPRPYTWGLSSTQAGALAARITLGRRPSGGRAQTPKFGRLAWLAVTAEELALLKLKSGNGVTVKPSEVIARVPRRELKTVEWHRGYVSPLMIVSATAISGTWRCRPSTPGTGEGRARAWSARRRAEVPWCSGMN